MNYLSVCSGIEAATVAWHDMGWKPIGFSEIEKFPSQLLQHHYPHVTNYGDMTKFKEWNINDTVGLLVGGTPCQSFSVAGLRKGLEDPRGNLMLTYLGIADHFKPKWILWENVPGVLSSNGGKDFACFLQGLAEIGYGFAYRVLDAQHFGVPQRRRRVFVVGCLGDWRSAAKVLFESESLCRDITPSRQKRKESSEYVADCVGTLLARDYKGIDSFDHTKMVAKSVSVIGVDTYNGTESGDIAVTMTAAGGSSTHSGPKVMVNNSQPFKETADCLTASYGTKWNGNASATNGSLFVKESSVISWDSELNPNIDKMGTLMRGGQGGRMDGVMQTNMKVRRLTPIECERLQGFYDNYTDIKPNGKPTPDGHRYKALGNSMAVPVMKWIGQRINELS